MLGTFLGALGVSALAGASLSVVLTAGVTTVVHNNLDPGTQVSNVNSPRYADQ